jgi:tetratricopeptide (TPR) repeat protein
MKNNPIYKAQCFGNVEPIEYMVPYPNLRSLVVGQCIKFSNNILYKDIGITNGDFYKSTNKAANWLLTKGIKKEDRVLITNIPSPMREILSYAIWSVGAVLVIANEEEIDHAINKTKPKLIISEITEEDKSIIDEQSEDYIEISSTLLLDEAVIYFNSYKPNYGMTSHIMFIKVIMEDPKYVKDGYDAYFYLGRIFEDIKDIGFAIELYTESIELNPDESLSFEKRGLCLLKKEDLKNAMSDLKKAETIAKGIDGYYLHLSALIKDIETRLDGFKGNSKLIAFYE